MFTVYGREDCSYCRKAKSALNEYDVKFNYISLEDKPELREDLRSQGFDTIPAIFLDGKELGGYEELEAWMVDNLL